jgi:hypothetical protein
MDFHVVHVTSEKTYIQNVIPKFEGLFGKEFKSIETSMSEGYHPEVDDSPLCTEHDSAKYRSIIGCCIWIIVLGRFDVAYATSAMSRFNMLPREGHLKAVKRILSYLKTSPEGKLIIDTYTLNIPCNLLRTIQIGWNSIQMLEKKFQRIFLLKKG